MILLAEPFSFPADALLERLGQDMPALPVLGGMASGGQMPRSNLVLFGPKAYDDGAVAVILDGAVRMRSVVSQGCQPIGRPFLVTKCERNLILELGRKPALEQFQEVYKELPTSEQSLVQRGLHVGIAMNEYQEDFSRGDFLVRNVVGADPSTGAIGIGDYAKVGQTVRFHLRDSKSADEDLRHLLDAYQQTKTGGVAGALLFTCNGRGTRMFEEPDHDAKVLQEVLGKVPVAGFFAQGEIGPVSNRNHLHGFTASIAIVETDIPSAS
jgi:small ligand-binding sensory domain FIST